MTLRLLLGRLEELMEQHGRDLLDRRVVVYSYNPSGDVKAVDVEGSGVIVFDADDD